jgi:hypothetical protein
MLPRWIRWPLEFSLGYRAAVAHQLPRAGEAGYLAQLRGNRYRRDLRNAAQRLQVLDHLLQRWRGQLDRLRNGLLQALDPLSRVLDFVQIIQPRGLLRHLLEAKLPHPDQVGLRPRLHARRRTLPRAQQKLAQPMPRP